MKQNKWREGGNQGEWWIEGNVGLLHDSVAFAFSPTPVAKSLT